MKGRNLRISARESHHLRSIHTSGTHNVGLPKVDLKSPTRVIEEKEISSKEKDVHSQGSTRAIEEDECNVAVSNEELIYERRRRRDSSGISPTLDHQKSVTKENDLKEKSMSPSPTQEHKQASGAVTTSHSVIAQRRNSSGTPVSVKSKVRIIYLARNLKC